MKSRHPIIKWFLFCACLFGPVVAQSEVEFTIDSSEVEFEAEEETPKIKSTVPDRMVQPTESTVAIPMEEAEVVEFELDGESQQWQEPEEAAPLPVKQKSVIATKPASPPAREPVQAMPAFSPSPPRVIKKMALPSAVKKAFSPTVVKTKPEPAAESEPKSEKVALPRVVEVADPVEREVASSPEPAPDLTEDTKGVDFKHEETFIDLEDAVKSREFVHRQVLSSVIETTSNFEMGRFYVNHLMGFSAVWQTGPQPFARYSTALQGLAVGYLTQGGHGLELGAEFSNVSNIYGGYRFFWEISSIKIWPFLGAGVGYQMDSMRLAEGPPQAAAYFGSKSMGFGTLGIFIPLVDVGFKAEVRLHVYGKDRVVFTQGIGAILFL